MEQSYADLAFEGFADLGEANVGTDASKDSTDAPVKGYDPRLQQRAVEVAKEIHGRLRRQPTKNDVAKEIAIEEGKTVKNILRRIKNTWTARGQRRPKLILGRGMPRPSVPPKRRRTR